MIYSIKHKENLKLITKSDQTRPPINN